MNGREPMCGSATFVMSASLGRRYVRLTFDVSSVRVGL